MRQMLNSAAMTRPAQAISAEDVTTKQEDRQDHRPIDQPQIKQSVCGNIADRRFRWKGDQGQQRARQ